MRHVAFLMASAFLHAGGIGSGGKKTAAEWMTDRNAYLSAMVGVVEALLIGLPNATMEDMALMFESLKGRLVFRIANKRVEQ